MNHEFLEKNVGALIVLILVAVSFGGAVEILPMVFERAAAKPSASQVERRAVSKARRERGRLPGTAQQRGRAVVTVCRLEP